MFEELNKHDIYPIAVDEGYMVYAPLSEVVMRLSADDLQRIEDYLRGNNSDSEAIELIDYLNSERKSQRTIPRKENINQIHKLTILPTYRCNFKCSYCYSSKGRESKELSRAKALGMIDYFINSQRTNLTDLWLAILGGGEPFLSPEITTEIIIHARKKAKEQGFNLGIGLTTNGSVFNENLAKVMVENKVSLGVSFEVLEDIQNLQRRNYAKVVNVVSEYMHRGVNITVKSIITPDNVCRLEEMVTELHRLFPEVKSYKLQIVEDPSLFSDLDVMRKFYDDFTENFFKAQELGKNIGIDVYVLASKYIKMLIEHYCGGEMCLNPQGTITICHRISSPREEGYHEFVYGNIDDDGNVMFDQERFVKLISHDIKVNPKCERCFVKWHCGGGCFAQSNIYGNDQLDVICEWTRSFSKEILLRRLRTLEKS